jgi:hypothetical protein
VRWHTRVAAVVLPALVVGGGLALLQPPMEATGRAAFVERRMLVGRPAVVVLGSSLARMDIDRAVLAAGLGIPAEEVEVITVPNATAAHWYAILKNHVFGLGLRPRLVIVAGALTTMVTPDVLNDVNLDRLLNFMGRDEEVLGRKVLRVEEPWQLALLRTRGRATDLRAGLVNGWRDLVVGRLFAPHGSAVEATNLVERVNETVFGDADMDYGLYGAGASSVFHGAVGEIDVAPSLVPERDSLLPDLGDLARSYGAKLVYARVPFPPSNIDNDPVDGAVERAAVDTIRGHGGIYLDLRDTVIEEDLFQDMRHMNPIGATRFSEALGRRVVSALSGGGPSVPLPDVAVGPAWLGRLAEGEVPTLTAAGVTAAGLSCGAWPELPVGASEVAPWLGLPFAGGRSGSGCPEGSVGWGGDSPLAWVRSLPLPARGVPGGAPFLVSGSGVAWSLSGPASRVQVAGLAFGSGGDVWVELGGARFDLKREGRRVWLDLPWNGALASLAVRVEGDLVVLVDQVVVEQPGAVVALVGGGHGDAVVRLLGAKPDDIAFHAVSAMAPPPVAAPAPRRGPRQSAIFVVPHLRPLADADSTTEAHPHRCSPVRVLEDGVPLSGGHAPCAEVGGVGAGRYCHAGDAVYFSASDGSDPLQNGRVYALDFDPERMCDVLRQAVLTPLRGLLWLYPGDVVALPLTPDDASEIGVERRRRLLGGIDALDITLERVSLGGDGSGDVRVAWGDDAEASRVVAVSDRASAVTLTLPSPVLVDAPSFAIRLENHTSDIVRVGPLLLRERTPFEGVGVEVSAEALADPLGLLMNRSAGISGPMVRVPPPRAVRWGTDAGGGFTTSQLRPGGEGAVSLPFVVVDEAGAWTLVAAADLVGCSRCFAEEGGALRVESQPDHLEVGVDGDPVRTDAAGNTVVWVVTGAAVQWIGEASTTDQPVAVDVSARPAGDGPPGGARLVVRICGREQEILKTDAGWGAHFRARCNPGVPWTAELYAPERGASWLVQSMTVEDAAGRWSLVAPKD